MAQGPQAPSSRALLMALRDLAALTVLTVLLLLVAYTTLRVRVARAGPQGADMAGDNGDAGSGSDSPGGYVVFESLWELPAQSPTGSEASPTGPKNETELEDVSWESEQALSDVLNLLMEIPEALKREPGDEEEPQEGRQAVPVPGGFTGTVEPTGVPGVDMRKLGRTSPKAVAGRADSTGNVFLRNCLVAVPGLLILLCLYMMFSERTKDVKGHLTAWRARFFRLCSRAKAGTLAVEV